MGSTTEVEVRDPSMLSFLAAREINAMMRARSRETRYLEAFASRIRGHMNAPNGLRGLKPSEWGMYRKAIESATSLRAHDAAGLAQGLEAMLGLLDAVKDDRLDDEESKTLLTFVLSLHGQHLAARRQPSAGLAEY
jgi:hypothetical protein